MRAMNRYALVFLLFLSATCLAQTAPRLMVSQNAAGQVVASVSGSIPACGVTASDDNPVFALQGAQITVTQHVHGVLCPNGVPPDTQKLYQATLNFGHLADGTYAINWSFPPLTATYTVTGNPGINIGAGITGAWFNPAQSGHGFDIQVLASQPPQLLVSWFVFTPSGGQAWVTGTGPISGNQAVVDGIQTIGSGAVFPPNFDPANVQQQFWGTVTVAFTDCNNGRVSWHSTIAGYGDGAMPITRLTLPAGLACP